MLRVAEMVRPPESWFARFGLRMTWGVALLISLPALFVEPLSDDFLRHLILELSVPGYSNDSTLLYDLTRGSSASELIRLGYLPWQAHPELSLRFFRPLSSLSVAADHALFGRAQVPAMVVNVGWFLGLCGVVMALLSRLLPRVPARLAGLMYVVFGGHAMNVAWVAARHLMVGAVFALLALYFHVCWRETQAPARRRWLFVAALASLALGMLSSESFLSGVAFILGYELFDRGDSRRRRLRAAAPAVLASVGYLAGYGFFGYGTRHSAVYLSPFSQPGPFSSALAERWPILLGELAGGFPSALWGAVPQAGSALVLLGLLTAVGVAWLVMSAPFNASERRRLRFLGLGAIAGCLPAAGGFLNGRMLVIPAFGASALIAWAIHRQWFHARQGWWRLLTKAAAGGFAFLHLVLAPLTFLAATKALADMASGQRALARTFDARSCQRGDVALLLTGADPSLSLSGAASLAFYRPELVKRVSELHVLSLAPHDLLVTRSAPQSLTLRVRDLPRHFNLFEPLFNDQPLDVGYEVDLGKLRAKVLGAEAGLPTVVNFEIPENSCLLMLRGGKLESARLPPVGEELLVRHELGPAGL